MPDPNEAGTVRTPETAAFEKGYSVRVYITQAKVSPQRKYDEAMKHYPESDPNSCEMRYHFSLGWSKADKFSGR